MAVEIEELLCVMACMGNIYINIQRYRNSDNNEKKQIIDKYAWDRYGIFHPFNLQQSVSHQEHRQQFTLHSQFNDNYF